MKVSVDQLYMKFSDPVDLMDCSQPDSSVLGILQAGILEWVAIPSSKGSSQTRSRIWVSHIVGRFFTNWAPREAAQGY